MSRENLRRPPHQPRRRVRLRPYEIEFFPEDELPPRYAAAALLADFEFAARLDLAIDAARGWFVEKQPQWPEQPASPISSGGGSPAS